MIIKCWIQVHVLVLKTFHWLNQFKNTYACPWFIIKSIWSLILYKHQHWQWRFSADVCSIAGIFTVVNTSMRHLTRHVSQVKGLYCVQSWVLFKYSTVVCCGWGWRAVWACEIGMIHTQITLGWTDSLDWLLGGVQIIPHFTSVILEKICMLLWFTEPV